MVMAAVSRNQRRNGSRCTGAHNRGQAAVRGILVHDGTCLPLPASHRLKSAQGADDDIEDSRGDAEPNSFIGLKSRASFIPPAREPGLAQVLVHSITDHFAVLGVGAKECSRLRFS
jgi:hypothetical protein